MASLLFDETIIRREGLDLAGSRSIERKAVRAVIVRDGALLMVRVGATGEYKFPGGGVEAGESDEDALRREVAEETGVRVRSVGPLIGRMTEYDRRDDDDADFFRMRSLYYAVEVDPLAGSQDLDAYERELGFTPCWISPREAFTTNQALLARGKPYPSKWTERETRALRFIVN